MGLPTNNNTQLIDSVVSQGAQSLLMKKESLQLLITNSASKDSMAYL